MKIKILLDHDLEGYSVFLKAAFEETGWNDYLTVEFIRLQSLGLPDDCSDQEIWRRVQQLRLLLVTHNRNCEDETSLQATIERENTPDSLPVITIASLDRLALAEYRHLAAHKLAEIALYLEDYLGSGRIYIP
jgi:hypothetical protein